MLWTHSKWFLNALTREFKEANEDVIKLQDDNPRTFETMLKYIYGRVYDNGGQIQRPPLRAYAEMQLRNTLYEVMDMRTLEIIIRGLYGLANDFNTQSSIGKALVNKTLYDTEFFESVKVDRLVKYFLSFASDLMVAQREKLAHDRDI
ncbi:hypothetical protein BCR34DRAFT_612763 [Clohesyomyces aquaticus]|uniref:BTB domain-containing protein n=1 Tax=Clohesyomyces aquaticus TaxID=1231657 RepID=A0A1Y1ZWC4_9PLEO|nr:hypothetical protein BCR34DRAFT_612763 [Clohesyomyces aquaticus]